MSVLWFYDRCLCHSDVRNVSSLDLYPNQLPNNPFNHSILHSQTPPASCDIGTVLYDISTLTILMTVSRFVLVIVARKG